MYKDCRKSQEIEKIEEQKTEEWRMKNRKKEKSTQRVTVTPLALPQKTLLGLPKTKAIKTGNFLTEIRFSTEYHSKKLNFLEFCMFFLHL